MGPWLWLLLCLAALLLLMVLAVFCVAFLRRPGQRKQQLDLSYIPEDCAPAVQAGVDWLLQQPLEEVRITSYDGLALSASFLAAETPRPKGILLMFHGWRSNRYTDFGCVYRLFHDQGYHLLTVCQRAQGESQGAFMTFGEKESRDCQSWAKYAALRFPELDIFLHGISMGGATVLIAAGLELPERVRAVVADSGFTSAWDQIRHMLKARHLPTRPFLDLEDLFCRAVGGFGLRRTPAPEALSRTKLPVLFIHGLADTFVPPEMSRTNYAACNSPKELVLVENAGHGLSYWVEPERVTQAVLGWLARWGSRGEDPGNGEKAQD